VLDAGELPISGWTFQLFKNNILIDTVQTNAQGVATYGPVDMDGTVYQWRETLPAGWAVTTGGTSQNTTANVPNPLVTFGNWMPINLTVRKFRDTDGDGVLDVGELPIQGWSFQLYKNNVLVTTVQTNAQGVATYGPVDKDGTVYEWRETLPANWAVTSVGGTTQSTTANTANPTTTFLNWQPTDLCGVKYYDANTNGTRDVGEPFIQNWLIEIRLKSSNTLVACGHTDANGEFCITVDGDGTLYIIEEVMAEPYKPSTATSVEVAATAPRTAAEFGNYALVSVTLTGYTKGGWQSDNNSYSQTLGHYTHGKKRLNEVDDDWRTLLNSLNLCTTGGQPYTVPEAPANNFETAFADFAAWLTGSVEGNMAFNLSSQMAAAALNLNFTEYAEYSMVHVFWNNEWVNLADAIQDAANLLDGNCLVTSSDPLFSQMQDLKNMFDAYNNNTLSTKAASPVPVPFVPVPCPE
jgi:hypothetical protein